MFSPVETWVDEMPALILRRDSEAPAGPANGMSLPKQPLGSFRSFAFTAALHLQPSPESEVSSIKVAACMPGKSALGVPSTGSPVA